MKTADEILKLAEFDVRRSVDAADRELLGQLRDNIVSSRVEMWVGGVKTENDRFMPLIQELADQLKLANERAEALRKGLELFRGAPAYSKTGNNHPPADEILAADEEQLAKLIKGEFEMNPAALSKRQRDALEKLKEAQDDWEFVKGSWGHDAVMEVLAAFADEQLVSEGEECEHTVVANFGTKQICLRCRGEMK